MSVKKRIAKLLALTVAAALCAGLTVTAQAAGTETDPAVEAEDYEGLDRIGQETEEGYKVKLTNATGTDIMGMNIQLTTDDTWTWSDELLAEEDMFEKEETALFCYTPGEDEGEAETEAQAQDEQTLYNIQIVFSDWTVGYLHNVLLSDMKEAEIQRAANSLPYLVYTSLASQEEIDTSEAEQAVFEGELASGFWDSVIGGGSSSGGSGSGGSSGGSSSGGGNTEGCVGGDALFN